MFVSPRKISNNPSAVRMEQNSKLPKNWVICTSTKNYKGRQYYGNLITKKSQWDFPKDTKIVNTLDGEVQISENSLEALKELSRQINTLIYETIPTFNFSSSYLMRLISVAHSSLDNQELQLNEYSPTYTYYPKRMSMSALEEEKQMEPPKYSRVFFKDTLKTDKEERNALKTILTIINTNLDNWIRKNDQISEANRWPHIGNANSFTKRSVELFITSQIDESKSDVVIVGNSESEPTAFAFMSTTSVGEKYSYRGWDKYFAEVSILISNITAPVGHGTFAMRLALKSALQRGSHYLILSAYITALGWYMNSIGVPAAILAHISDTNAFECFERSKAYSLGAGDDLSSIFSTCLQKGDKVVNVVFALHGRAAMSALNFDTFSSEPVNEEAPKGLYVQMFPVEKKYPLVIGYSYDIALEGNDITKDHDNRVSAYVIRDRKIIDCGVVYFAGYFIGFFDENDNQLSYFDLTQDEQKYNKWFTKDRDDREKLPDILGNDEWHDGTFAKFSNCLIKYNDKFVFRRSYIQHKDERDKKDKKIIFDLLGVYISPTGNLICSTEQ